MSVFIGEACTDDISSSSCAVLPVDRGVEGASWLRLELDPEPLRIFLRALFMIEITRENKNAKNTKNDLKNDERTKNTAKK